MLQWCSRLNLVLDFLDGFLIQLPLIFLTHYIFLTHVSLRWLDILLFIRWFVMILKLQVFVTPSRFDIIKLNVLHWLVCTDIINHDLVNNLDLGEHFSLSLVAKLQFLVEFDRWRSVVVKLFLVELFELDLVKLLCLFLSCQKLFSLIGMIF